MQETVIDSSRNRFSENIVWGAVPDGFQRLTDLRGNRLVVRSDRQQDLNFTTCLEIESRGDAVGIFGRGEMRAVRLSDGTTALFRCYHHGGLFRSWTGKWFISRPPRPFRELSVTEELRRRGFPTVEVLAAYVKKIRGPFYHGWLVTRQLEDARDLWLALQSGFCQSFGVDTILEAVAASIRRMHREGVYHRDLNLKNILVRSGSVGVESYIIDFDKSILVLGQLPAPLAQKNLARLLRSIRKLDPQRQYFSAAYWDKFLAYYNAAAA